MAVAQIMNMGGAKGLLHVILYRRYTSFLLVFVNGAALNTDSLLQSVFFHVGHYHLYPH